MAQIAYGGIIGFFGGTSFTGNYYLTRDGYLADANGNVSSATVFSQELATLHRTADVLIVPDNFLTWAPDAGNNEWDAYSIGTAPAVGTAAMVDGPGIELLSPDLAQDDYDHDTIRYTFNPTAAAWQSLSAGQTLTVTFTVSAIERSALFGNIIDSDTFTVTLNFTMVCFARGTLIETLEGPVAIEDLQPGMLCRTLDADFQPLRWRGSARVGGGHHGIPENMKPIRIAAGALGNGLPSTDLLVSPQHRMLVSSRIAERMFGAREVLIAAKHLTGLQGVEVAEDLHEVEYWHLLFDDHQIVIANGAASESLYTGPMALSAVSEASRQEILTLFPQLAEMTYDALPSQARLAIPGRRARRFVERVASNAPAAGAVLQ